MLMLTSAGFLAAAPPPPPGDYVQIGSSVGVDFRCPVAPPGTLPYNINVTDPTGTEPRTLINISCTILVYAPHAATAAQNQIIEAFQQYIKYNIEAVWNSSSNALISPQYIVSCSINIIRVYSNTGDLPADQLFMMVKTGPGRSFSDRPKHAAAFFIDAALESDLARIFNLGIRRITPAGASPVISPATQTLLSKLKPTTPNVPAHEFGHILGLADRYAYLAYVLTDVSFAPKIITDRAHIVPLYVDAARDPEYGKDFQWLFNLMSTQMSPVPALPAGKRPIPWSSDAARNHAITVQDTLRYRELYPAVDPLPAAVPGRINIYLTAAQLAVIASKSDEYLPGTAMLYFKKVQRHEYLTDATAKIDGETVSYKLNCLFRGTFVGPITNANGTTVHVTHDDHYDMNRNGPSWFQGFFDEADDNPTKFLLLKVGNDAAANPDARMDMRCYYISTNGIDGTKVGLAPGLVDAALDIGALAAGFNERSEVEPVPLRLAELLDVEHLDRRVAIRRFVGEYIQDKLNQNGDLIVSNSGRVIRKIVLNRLGDIKINETLLTAPDDLFANLPDICSGGNLAFIRGLFVPYEESDKNSKTRHGKTWFYIGPKPTKTGETIQIQDSYGLTLETATTGLDGNLIRGPEANVIRAIWNFSEDLPIPKNRAFTSPFVMAYDAQLYSNRIKLIALVNNGRLQDDDGPNDPKTYSLGKCFVISDFPGPLGGPTTPDLTPPNANPGGRYLGLQYRFL